MTLRCVCNPFHGLGQRQVDPRSSLVSPMGEMVSSKFSADPISKVKVGEKLGKMWNIHSGIDEYTHEQEHLHTVGLNTHTHIPKDNINEPFVHFVSKTMSLYR